jgi:hypothetical protein
MDRNNGIIIKISMRIKKPFIIAGVVAAMVALDLMKFLTVGGVTIVNWHSFIHPFWVALAVILLFIGAKRNEHGLSSALFWLYAIIFFASYVNQYFIFTSVLTYNCMLFNAIFAVAHYLSSGQRNA